MVTGSLARRRETPTPVRPLAPLALALALLALGGCAAYDPWYGSAPPVAAGPDAGGATPAVPAWPTVTMPALLARLAGGEDQAELIADVRVFGLAAAPTEADIDALRAAGASPALVDAVRAALVNPALAAAPPGVYPPGAAYPPVVGYPPGAYPPVWAPYPAYGWWPFAFGLGWFGGSSWYGYRPRPPYPPPAWRPPYGPPPPGARPPGAPAGMPPPGAGPRPGFGGGPKPIPAPRAIPYKGRR